MRVLFGVSEAVPFVKTGGLGDVAGALPAALRELGHDVRLVLPRYRTVPLAGLLPRIPVQVPMGGRLIEGTVLEGASPAGVPVYFVDAPAFFDRPGVYGEAGHDYEDNLIRFAYFSQAVVQVAEHLFPPDLVHCHDWHTALVPAYLHRRRPLGQPSWPTLITIHNIAMQGTFPREQFGFLGLPEEYFSLDGLEFYGRINLLKAGLVHADLITTVSQTYAQEIQTPEFGAGLDGVLRARSRDLFGVLNGVDYAQWDPRVDPHLPARYGPGDLAGKRVCKRALQRERGLAALPYAPLVGMVTRLTDQKGCDLVVEALPALVDRGLQFVLLGEGDSGYHARFRDLAARYPRRVSVEIGFDEGLAHRIEAGADMFLMPSRFEPSGLNQLYSMRYGTVPVVRRTGGLADSVVDATPESVREGKATGFLFDAFAVGALLGAVDRALLAFRAPPTWRRIQQAAMCADFSWARSAGRYAALYAETVGRRIGGGARSA